MLWKLCLFSLSHHFTCPYNDVREVRFGNLWRHMLLYGKILTANMRSISFCHVKSMAVQSTWPNKILPYKFKLFSHRNIIHLTKLTGKSVLQIILPCIIKKLSHFQKIKLPPIQCILAYIPLSSKYILHQYFDYIPFQN